MVATDTDFVPSSDYPVHVVLGKSALKYTLSATMRDGNVAYVEDKGKIPVGTFSITVTCCDDNGNPYRFKQNAVLQVVDATIDAGIEQPIEYEVTTWYLDAALYLALKGEDGVGIEDIHTQSSGEIGGMNVVTIVLTDGRTKSFGILNGSGSVDDVLDINSPSPIANKTVTARFNEISNELAGLFGDVDYDSQSKSIRFWDKGKTTILASLDARPFIKDGMVNSVYISNNTLVITFNTDSGREAIGVPLSSVFNPNNYYTKTQVDNRIAAAVANVQIDTSTLMTKAQYTYPERDAAMGGKIIYDALPHLAVKFIEDIGESGTLEGGDVYAAANGHIYESSYFDRTYDLGAVPNIPIFNKADNLFYRYVTNEGWVQVGGSGSGINAVYDATNERIIFPAGSAVVVNERLIIL